MDFEDFEFKPLTEGLGFHKKNPSSSKDEVLPPLEPREKFDFEAALEKTSLDQTSKKSTSFFSKVDTPKFEDQRAHAPKVEGRSEKFELPEIAPETSVSSAGLFSKPLPRTEADVPKVAPTPAPSIPKFNPRFSKPLSNINKFGKSALANPAIQDQKIQDSGLIAALSANAEAAKTNVQHNKVDTAVEVKYTEAAPSALSLFLDLTVISGLSILFTLGLVVATNIDIVPVLNNVASDGGTQIGIALLVYSVAQLYLILARSFFGQTLGEWSMDTQLGLPKEQQQISYIFKLISRTLVLTLTGFIILPLISMIIGKDLTGRAASLKLYAK